jgi:RNA polymerase sigma factor (sigma-70 family)
VRSSKLMPHLKKIVSDNDQQLWSAFRVGNHEAYTLLIQSYFKPMFTYGIRLNKDSDFVKDCIQDVFCDLWKRRTHISQADSVKSYLFTAVRNRIYREQKKWNNFDEVSDDYAFDAEINIEVKIIEDQSTIELKRKIETVLNNMPPRQREILYLRFYENMDHGKIAEIMGLNQQVVYNLLHKAILRLRKDWVMLAWFFYGIDCSRNFIR